MHLIIAFEHVTARKEDKTVKDDPWGPVFQKSLLKICIQGGVGGTKKVLMLWKKWVISCGKSERCLENNLDWR